MALCVGGSLEDGESFKEKAKVFGIFWSVFFGAFLLVMLYNNGVTIANLRGTERRFVSPETDPWQFYFTLAFVIINFLIGIYLFFWGRKKG